MAVTEIGDGPQLVATNRDDSCVSSLAHPVENMSDEGD